MITKTIFFLFMSLLTTASGLFAANFGDDLQFLRQHTGVVLLQDKAGGAQVAVVPAWQGRVMTSTARGASGASFGWVNRELIASGKLQPHINVFGGEDRFWLGPEGGQFSVFFAKGVSFDLKNWFTPAALDTEPFAVVKQSADSVLCRRDIQLTNYSGTRFSLSVDREVRLVPAKEAVAGVGGVLPAGVSAVAFESVNTIKNTGAAPWTKTTGLLSVWILGMFNASPESTAVIPFVTGPEAKLGPIVNDTYFGKVPADRLVVKDGVLFFRADAQFRSKIGLSPRRAKSVLGSYDAANRTLTLVKFTLLAGVTDYVNSMWELQNDPFHGDAVNSYNDDGKLGRFYELESSSPALALAPGASATHRHQTIHLQGDEKELDAIAQATLGVRLDAIKRAFK
ncbi:MAG: hypothetical protein JNK23_23410 [Opitutaceae bacterium]|nr:hypothetical protein [Opitutaceae bacterium]